VIAIVLVVLAPSWRNTLNFVALNTREKPATPVRKHRASKAIKVRLLTRKSLDGRTRARKQFDAIANGIASDLGGEDHLSTVQRNLVEAFAGAAVHVHDLNARLLKGEPVDVLTHSQAISSMVRIAARIGINRVARDVSPNLQEYLEQQQNGESDDAE
jgi:hypothetical protein